jgi:hypothetical protein
LNYSYLSDGTKLSALDGSDEETKTVSMQKETGDGNIFFYNRI